MEKQKDENDDLPVWIGVLQVGPTGELRPGIQFCVHGIGALFSIFRVCGISLAFVLGLFRQRQLAYCFMFIFDYNVILAVVVVPELLIFTAEANAKLYPLALGRQVELERECVEENVRRRRTRTVCVDEFAENVFVRGPTVGRPPDEHFFVEGNIADFHCSKNVVVPFLDYHIFQRDFSNF